jgi:hypothetical protein
MAVGVAEAAGHITLATIAAFLMAVALSTLDQPEVPPPPTARYLEHLRQASAIISDVPRLQFSELQEAAFYRELVLRSQPAIIEGWITTGWPASSLWTDSYLTRAAGHVGIQVESIGADAHVFDPEDLRRGGEDRYHTMGLGEFLVAYQQPGRARNYYAAEVPLPAELAAEVHPPPWVTMPLDPSVAQPALWIGGPNHTTPIHRDMYENVYCMVRGGLGLGLGLGSGLASPGPDPGPKPEPEEPGARCQALLPGGAMGGRPHVPGGGALTPLPNPNPNPSP